MMFGAVVVVGGGMVTLKQCDQKRGAFQTEVAAMIAFIRTIIVVLLLVAAAMNTVVVAVVGWKLFTVPQY